MFGWLLTIGRFVLRRPQTVVDVARSAGELVEAVDAAIHDDPPPQPLTRADLDHIARQRDAATAHKVRHPDKHLLLRTVPVCEACWRARYPGATPRLAQTHGDPCVVCEAAPGRVWIRVSIEWLREPL